MSSIEPKNPAGLPAQYFDVLAPIILGIKENLEKEGKLQPFAYLGCTAPRGLTPLSINTQTHLAKIESAKHITRTAKLVDADFVAIAMESYYLPANMAHLRDELIDEYGSPQECPDYISVVSFSVETETTLWIATFPIKPKGRSKITKTIAAPKATDFTAFGVAEGIFVGLLPGSRLGGLAQESNTLH